MHYLRAGRARAQTFSGRSFWRRERGRHRSHNSIQRVRSKGERTNQRPRAQTSRIPIQFNPIRSTARQLRCHLLAEPRRKAALAPGPAERPDNGPAWRRCQADEPAEIIAVIIIIVVVLGSWWWWPPAASQGRLAVAGRSRILRAQCAQSHRAAELNTLQIGGRPQLVLPGARGRRGRARTLAADGPGQAEAARAPPSTEGREGDDEAGLISGPRRAALVCLLA